MAHPTTTEGAASPVLPGDWVADPAACTLAFAVRNFAVRTVTGQIPLISAVVHVGPRGEPVSLRAELDASGIRTGNARRDHDLRGRRFLATDRWPVITFEAGYIQPAQTGWTVSGTLTVKDTQCPVRLDVARFTTPAEGRGSGRPARDRPPGPPLSRRDRRAGLPHRSPDLALAAGGAAPAAGRTAAALTRPSWGSRRCSRPPRNWPGHPLRFTALPAAGRARGRVLPVAAEVPGPHQHVTWGQP